MSKTYDCIPYAGWWYLLQLVFDGKNANRRLYEYYKHKGIVKVKGITLGDEIVLFNLEDVKYCHKHEGIGPGGAGDTLFTRLTQYFSEPKPQNGLGPHSHGRNMFGRGVGHNKTRKLAMSSKMKSSPSVLTSAIRVVDLVERYDDFMEWVQFSQIDMFFSVMTGISPDLTNPEAEHPLKRLPEDEEKAFVSGLLLSVLPKCFTRTMEAEFVDAMDNMTGLGVQELDTTFLSLSDDERPESFMKSLLRTGTEQDARELMALFITAFQGNIALTFQNLIFHVANNPTVQDKLYEEIVRACETGDHMQAQMPYLAAIFSESHRLTPITDFTQVRVYEHDITLPSGWELPAGSKVMMLNKLSTRDKDLVCNAGKFIPERFLHKEPDENLSHFLQRSEFGSSSRSCLGRRTAKVMLKAVVIELFKRYHLEAFPHCTTFSIDPVDPSFNRIKNFPKINLRPRT